MRRIAPKGLFENTKPGANLNLPHRPEAAPSQEILASSQQVYLRVQETSKYVNIDGSGWAQLQDTQDTKYVLVKYYAYHYIVVATGSYKNYYLSYNNSYYVGAYSSWNDARYWSVDPVDCSPYPGLYPYDKSGVTYLCCNGVNDALDKLITVVSY